MVMMVMLVMVVMMVHAVMVMVMYRARRFEARIQQMLWKVNYSDIVFINAVCMSVYDVSNITVDTKAVLTLFKLQSHA